MEQYISALTRLKIPRCDAESLSGDLQFRTFAPGEIVRDCPRMDAEVLFLTSGRVSVQSLCKEGVEVGAISAPGFVGASLLLPGWAPGYVVVAESQVEGLACTAQRLRDAFEGSPALRAVLLAHCGRLLGDLLVRAACHAMHGAEQRLASWLLVQHYSSSDPITMTHEVLAKRLGVRRATVTTALHLLEAEGGVRAKRACIDVRNTERLLRCSCGCHGYATSDFPNPAEPTAAEIALGASMAKSRPPTSRRAFA